MVMVVTSMLVALYGVEKVELGGLECSVGVHVYAASVLVRFRVPSFAV